MDDKSAVKAKGLWEDWHMRQLGEQPGRNNHRSGTGFTPGGGGASSPADVVGNMNMISGRVGTFD